jgi:putative endonuclease
MTTRQQLGQLGEQLAAAELERRGYAILTRNWRCAHGELDLVARDGDALVAVEVRTRRSQAYGSPEESLTTAKLAHLAAAAQTYVQTVDWNGPWRIDVVAIVIDARGRVERLTVIANAVEG